MKLVKVYMKSGNIIEFETDSITTNRERFTGALDGMRWNRHSNNIDLEYMNLNEVEGITVENIKSNKVEVNMCRCKECVEFGDYERMVDLVDKNGKVIQVDKCLAGEIEYLRNNHDINTKASCCGHNKVTGFIAVDIDDIQKMIDLGYENIINPNYPDAKEFFKPKYNKYFKDA